MDSYYDHFKEAGTELPYSPNHQIDDINAIKQVIETNNSLLVLGLSGSGKSSVLRFLVSNPAAAADNIFFVYIDCNGVDWDNTKGAIQEEIYGQLIDRLVTLKPKIPRGESVKDNLTLLMKALKKDGPKHLVIIFDRSELLLANLEIAFFDHLRALRDINPRLSYIFGGRYLDGGVFGELTDIIWEEPRWIGALSEEDARWTVTRHLTRLKLTLSETEIDKLINFAGHHPGLLKYACELVKLGKIDLNDDDGNIVNQMLITNSVGKQCQDLWQDLSLKAQNILRQIAQSQKVTASSDTRRLVNCGILKDSVSNEFEFESPVFKHYVTTLGATPLDIKQGVVFKGSDALNLSKEEFELFQILWNEKPNVVSQDMISEAIWPDTKGAVTPQMITNVVKRLRDKLGDKSYIVNEHGRGYRFIQGTAPPPRLDTHTATQRT